MSLRRMVEGDSTWARLVAAGLSEGGLREIARGGGRKKALDAESPGADENVRQTFDLLHLGGSIAGGAALDYVMGTRLSKDIDMFFETLEGYAAAMIRTWRNPHIDVVMAHGKPYGSFDVHASMCSVSLAGAEASPECERAIKTGVSGIELRNVLLPEATLRRVVKYGRVRGFKFLREQVILIGAAGGVGEALVGEALTQCL